MRSSFSSILIPKPFAGLINADGLEDARRFLSSQTESAIGDGLPVKTTLPQLG
jgi:hypothetical protein